MDRICKNYYCIRL